MSSDYENLINNSNFDSGFFSEYDNIMDDEGNSIDEDKKIYLYAINRKFRNNFSQCINLICNKKDMFDNWKNAFIHYYENNSFGELTKIIHKPIINNDSLMISICQQDLVVAIEDKYIYDLYIGDKLYIENLNNKIIERKIIDNKVFIDVSNDLHFRTYSILLYLKINISTEKDLNPADHEVTIISILLCNELKRILIEKNYM